MLKRKNPFSSIPVHLQFKVSSLEYQTSDNFDNDIKQVIKKSKDMVSKMTKKHKEFTVSIEPSDATNLDVIEKVILSTNKEIHDIASVNNWNKINKLENSQSSFEVSQFEMKKSFEASQLEMKTSFETKIKSFETKIKSLEDQIFIERDFNRLVYSIYDYSIYDPSKLPGWTVSRKATKKLNSLRINDAHYLNSNDNKRLIKYKTYVMKNKIRDISPDCLALCHQNFGEELWNQIYSCINSLDSNYNDNLSEEKKQIVEKWWTRLMV